MKIVIFTASANHPRFAETLRKFGKNLPPEHTVVIHDGPSYIPCDVAVFFGSWKNRNAPHHNIKRQIVEKAPVYIVLETPILGRKKVTDFMEDEWYRVGVNGFLNDDGTFNNKNMPGDRWKKISSELNIDFSGFRTNNKDNHILLALQIPGDAALKGTNITKWAYASAHWIRAITNRKIIVRYPQLPRQYDSEYLKKLKSIPNIAFQKGTKENLETTLAKVSCTVTYTSGLAVDSILAGTPTIAMHPANFAYSISSNHLWEINNPKLGSVRQWLYDLSYCQWHVDEIEAGLSWQHLEETILEKRAESSTV